MTQGRQVIYPSENLRMVWLTRRTLVQLLGRIAIDATDDLHYSRANLLDRADSVLQTPACIVFQAE
jgi:hypothetical protein